MGRPDNTGEDKPLKVVKTTTDLQRLKLEKLMKNPDKPVEIPNPRKEKSLGAAPEFVRNVMGSSAGAGSGEFHVYRQIRRREYARQKHMTHKTEIEAKDEEFHKRVEENKRKAELLTEKKRLKRLKKKEKMKKNKMNKKAESKDKEKTQELKMEEDDGEDIDDEDLDEKDGDESS